MTDKPLHYEKDCLEAAAPEMLRALKAFVHGCDHLHTPELALARAAIRAATGPESSDG